MSSNAESHKKWQENNRQKVREYCRKWRQKNCVAYTREWRKANREKHLAHQAVARAIDRGVLVKPNKCEQCGVSGIIHAHHDDYKKRLDVRWLCPICHAAVHNGPTRFAPEYKEPLRKVSATDAL